MPFNETVCSLLTLFLTFDRSDGDAPNYWCCIVTIHASSHKAQCTAELKKKSSLNLKKKELSMTIEEMSKSIALKEEQRTENWNTNLKL